MTARTPSPTSWRSFAPSRSRLQPASPRRSGGPPFWGAVVARRDGPGEATPALPLKGGPCAKSSRRGWLPLTRCSACAISRPQIQPNPPPLRILRSVPASSERNLATYPLRLFPPLRGPGFKPGVQCSRDEACQSARDEVPDGRSSIQACMYKGGAPRNSQRASAIPPRLRFGGAKIETQPTRSSPSPSTWRSRYWWSSR